MTRPTVSTRSVTLKPKALCVCGHNDLMHGLMILAGKSGCMGCACAGFMPAPKEAKR